MKYLTYGECPNCGERCQPPDYPNEDGLEYCYCCDCQIDWLIHHTEKNKGRETYLKIWGVSDIEKFGLIKPFGCR